jgi:sugar lactone lactonase YvrE
MKQLVTLLFSSIVLLTQAQTLSNIESVEYDPTNQIFLVSNGNNVVRMHSDAVPQGTLGVAKADYGMEVMNGILFSIVGSAVKGYDVTTGAQVMTKTISGAVFLNGMASNGVDKIWVTDFSAKKVHELNVSDLANPTSTVIVAATGSTPNGICYDATQNRLVMVSWGTNAAIKAIDLSTYTMTTLVTTGLGNIDGIDNDNYGNYYVASWSPNAITKYSNEFTTTQTITVTGGVSSPADICYAEEVDTLAIPCTGNNVVKFVGFNPSFVGNLESNVFEISGYPTQASDIFQVSFSLATSQLVKVELFDMQGKLIQTPLIQNLPQGQHQIVLSDLPNESGMYYVRVSAGARFGTTHFLK